MARPIQQDGSNRYRNLGEREAEEADVGGDARHRGAEGGGERRLRTRRIAHQKVRVWPVSGSLKERLVACMFYIRNQNLIDRSAEDLEHHPAIKPLFPDSAAEGIRYYKKTGIYPINHGMVIKRQVVERNPWAVINILKVFSNANDIAEHERRQHVAYQLETGLLPPHYREALATRLIEHGVKANRSTLEVAGAFSNQQGLTPRVVKIDEIFAPSAMSS